MPILTLSTIPKAKNQHGGICRRQQPSSDRRSVSGYRRHMSSMITDHHLQHKLDLIFDTSGPGYRSRTALKAAGLVCVIAHEQRYRHVTLRHLQKTLNSSGRGLETTLTYLFDRRILRTQSLRLEHDGINRTNVYSVSCSTVQHHPALDSQVSPHSQRHLEIHNRFLSTSPRKVSWQVFLRAIGLYHVILRMRASENPVTLQSLATFLKTRSKNPLVGPLQFLSKHDFIKMTLRQVPGQISREYRIDVHPAESRHMSFVLRSLEERLAADNHRTGLLARQMNKNAINASARRGDDNGTEQRQITRPET